MGIPIEWDGLLGHLRAERDPLGTAAFGQKQTLAEGCLIPPTAKNPLKLPQT